MLLESTMLSAPQEYIFNSPQKINLFMGGTGSGKTYLDGIISANFVKNYSTVYGFIGANTYDQLNTSTLKRIRDVWRDVHGWVENKHYVVGKHPPSNFDLTGHNFDRYDSIISFINGAVIYKGSLDNYEIHAGKEFGWGILDETWLTKEEAVTEVILTRLRQPGIIWNGKNTCPLYITTTPAKVEWINDLFCFEDFENEILSVIYDKNDFFHKEYSNKCVVICSIYWNEQNLSPDYIPNLITEHSDRNGKLKESGQRLIYANPFVKAGGEFYSSFDRIIHTGNLNYIPEYPIHISFDFNVVPYITMEISQVVRKDKILEIRFIDEICLASPDNKTDKLCREFEGQYKEKLKRGLYYYGDATGKNQDTRGLNDWQIIENTLRAYLHNFSKRVPYRNPAVSARRAFINNLLDGKHDTRIIIDKKCKELIRDLEFVKEDATGHKLKEVVKDKNTGQSYEKYGHASDAMDYMLTNMEILKDIFKKNYT